MTNQEIIERLKEIENPALVPVEYIIYLLSGNKSIIDATIEAIIDVTEELRSK